MTWATRLAGRRARPRRPNRPPWPTGANCIAGFRCRGADLVPDHVRSSPTSTSSPWTGQQLEADLVRHRAAGQEDRHFLAEEWSRSVPLQGVDRVDPRRIGRRPQRRAMAARMSSDGSVTVSERRSMRSMAVFVESGDPSAIACRVWNAAPAGGRTGDERSGAAAASPAQVLESQFCCRLGSDRLPHRKVESLHRPQQLDELLVCTDFGQPPHVVFVIALAFERQRLGGGNPRVDDAGRAIISGQVASINDDEEA